MPITVAMGFRVDNNDPVEDRLIFATKEDVFKPGSQGGLARGRRYEGLLIYISDEQKNYRFIGGVEEEHLISDPASGGGGGGDAILIDENHWFADEQARDDYFTANPEELKDELMVAVKFPGEGFSYISQYFEEKELEPEVPETPAHCSIADYDNETDCIDNDGTWIPLDPGSPAVVEPAHWVNKYALAQGPKGDTPYINGDGNWQIGEEDTGIQAEGVTPHIDATTKNWFIGEIDTGILAEGKDGHDGSGVVAVDTFSELVTPGEKNTLYIVRDEDITYRWDDSEQEYIQVGGGGASIPEPEDNGVPHARVRESGQEAGEWKPIQSEWEVIAPTILPEDIFVIPGADETSLLVSWYSDNEENLGAYARVYEGFDPTPINTFSGVSVQASQGKMSHSVELAGLNPTTEYQYELSVDSVNWTPKYSVTVSKSPIVKFAVVSDIHASSYNQAGNFSTPNTVEQGWKDCVTKVEAEGVDFLLATGDNVDTGTNESQYQVLASPHQLRNIPFAPVMGNHDVSNNFVWRFAYPNKQGTSIPSEAFNYWFKRGNVLFVVLNTSPWVSNVLETEQYLDIFKGVFTQAKAAHPSYDWLVVSHHKSTASIALHTCDLDIEKYVEAGFEKLMTDEGVDVVFAGHDHVRVNSQLVAWDATAQGSIPSATGTYYLTLGSSSGAKFYNQFAWEPGSENSVYPLLADGQHGSEFLAETNPPSTFGEYDDTVEPEYTIVEVDGLEMKIQSYDLDGIAILNELVIDKN